MLSDLLRVVVTEGTRADCKEACALIDDLSAEALLTDRGYDSNELIDKVVESGCQPVIPPRKNRREQRDYDRELYRVRHLVENAFLHLGVWVRAHANGVIVRMGKYFRI